MKVAHNNNSSTAVVGNLEVIKMGIDDSPAFFHILSSSLYQHPIMAFIREVISNAEDARRCSDNPLHSIEITITEEEFCVKDMGTGIPHDLIKDVYGTYGKGTKADDSNSIGGFGLGCKSPHAYCDKFDVLSANNGIATLYAVTKGGTISGGSNAIIPITQYTTNETGITVKIPIKSYQDYKLITQLTNAFISLGDINATVNGETVAKLGMSMEEGTLTFLPSNIDYIDAMPTIKNSTLCVRIANVLYPMPVPTGDNPAYEEAYKSLMQLYNTIHNQNDNVYLNKAFIQAAPDMIDIQPSREALSVTTNTVEYLTKLIELAYDKAFAEFKKGHSFQRTEYTKKNANFDIIKEHNTTLLSFPDMKVVLPSDKPMSDFYLIGRSCFSIGTLKSEEAYSLLKQYYSKLKIDNTISADTFSFILKFLKLQKKEKHVYKVSIANSGRHYSDNKAVLHSSKLEIQPAYGSYTKYISKSINLFMRRIKHKFNLPVTTDISLIENDRYNQYSPIYVIGTMPVLHLHYLDNNNLVLHKNKITLEDRFRDAVSNKIISNKDMVTVVMRPESVKKSDLTIARKYITNTHLPALDMTVVLPHEAKQRSNVSMPSYTPKARKSGTGRFNRTKEGFVTLSSVLKDGKVNTDNFLTGTDNIDYVEKPLMVFKINISVNIASDRLSLDTRHCTYNNTQLILFLAKYLGDKIGIYYRNKDNVDANFGTATMDEVRVLLIDTLIKQLAKESKPSDLFIDKNLYVAEAARSRLTNARYPSDIARMAHLFRNISPKAFTIPIAKTIPDVFTDLDNFHEYGYQNRDLREKVKEIVSKHTKPVTYPSGLLNTLDKLYKAHLNLKGVNLNDILSDKDHPLHKATVNYIRKIKV